MGKLEECQVRSQEVGRPLELEEEQNWILWKEPAFDLNPTRPILNFRLPEQ
jgi:hypothetical protein